jgi:hypothetical protein
MDELYHVCFSPAYDSLKIIRAVDLEIVDSFALVEGR